MPGRPPAVFWYGTEAATGRSPALRARREGSRTSRWNTPARSRREIYTPAQRRDDASVTPCEVYGRPSFSTRHRV